MNNTVIALDILAGWLNVTAELNTLLRNAATEGRDLTDDEIAHLKKVNDALEQDAINY